MINLKSEELLHVILHFFIKGFHPNFPLLAFY